MHSTRCETEQKEAEAALAAARAELAEATSLWEAEQLRADMAEEKNVEDGELFVELEPQVASLAAQVAALSVVNAELGEEKAELELSLTQRCELNTRLQVKNMIYGFPFPPT